MLPESHVACLRTRSPRVGSPHSTRGGKRAVSSNAPGKIHFLPVPDNPAPKVAKLKIYRVGCGASNLIDFPRNSDGVSTEERTKRSVVLVQRENNTASRYHFLRRILLLFGPLAGY